MKSQQYYVYILTNVRLTVFYTGITRNLTKRIWEHKNKFIKGFTAKYNLDQLVYFEIFSSPYEAIEREKQIKDFRREKKIKLVRSKNKKFCDLYQKIL